MIRTCRTACAACSATRDVRTAFQMGWAALANGELLSAAEAAGFEVLVACDQNLRHQNELAGRRIGLVVLWTTNWRRLREDAAPIAVAVGQVAKGGFVVVDPEALRS